MRGELVSFRDERGRELLDLPGAPRPDPGTPAPVRFLPAFDNAVLGYQDRGRIIDDPHRGLSVTGARFVLVDGRVSATWTVKDGTVTVAPLRRLTRPERAEVAAEGRPSRPSSPRAGATVSRSGRHRPERPGRPA